MVIGTWNTHTHTHNELFKGKFGVTSCDISCLLFALYIQLRDFCDIMEKFQHISIDVP